MPDRVATRPAGIVLVVVTLAGTAVAGLFSLPVRILGIALGGPLIICGMYLYYGIPLRELVRRYRGFLIVWAVVFVAAFTYAATQGR
jgi:hypothetical protein